MGGPGEFIEFERRSAENLAAAARRAGVERIVYLGGLHAESDRLSTHLRSRSQVGEILLISGVPTVVLQAGVVIGSGSASFEMIRHLTNRLPVMTTPRWVNNHTSRERRAGLLVMNNVPPPQPGTVYQMWLLGPSGATLAGTMDAAAVSPSTTAVIPELGDSTALGFSVETGSGSQQPSGQMIVEMPLR